MIQFFTKVYRRIVPYDLSSDLTKVKTRLEGQALHNETIIKSNDKYVAILEADSQDRLVDMGRMIIAAEALDEVI